MLQSSSEYAWLCCNPGREAFAHVAMLLCLRMQEVVRNASSHSCVANATNRHLKVIVLHGSDVALVS